MDAHSNGDLFRTPAIGHVKSAIDLFLSCPQSCFVILLFFLLLEQLVEATVDLILRKTQLLCQCAERLAGCSIAQHLLIFLGSPLMTLDLLSRFFPLGSCFRLFQPDSELKAIVAVADLTRRNTHLLGNAGERVALLESGADLLVLLGCPFVNQRLLLLLLGSRLLECLLLNSLGLVGRVWLRLLGVDDRILLDVLLGGLGSSLGHDCGVEVSALKVWGDWELILELLELVTEFNFKSLGSFK